MTTVIARKKSVVPWALLLGAIAALATPPVDQHWLVWPVLAGFAFILFRAPEPTSPKRWKRFVARTTPGIAFGFAINFVALRFVVPTITRFTSLPFPVAVLCLFFVALEQGLGWGVGASIARSLASRGVPRYLAFTIGVYAAMFFPSLFPWTAGIGLSPWPVFMQLADMIGERGVTALCALIGGLLATGIEHALKREKKAAAMYAALGLAVLGLMALEGTLRMRSVDQARASAEHAKIALVQPSTPALARWEEHQFPTLLQKLNGITRSAETQGAFDLTVWPESAYPYPLIHSTTRSPPGEMAVLAPGVKGPVLFGSFTRELHVDGNHESFNSAQLAFGNGDVSRPYDKRSLLWFGETVPLGDQIPWLRETFSRGTGLSPGEKIVRLDAGKIHAAVLICYEDTLISAGRDAMWVEPNLLVNVTNDAWFSGTSEGELHMRLAAMRSIEVRRDMVRSVNFGPTGLVDAAGRIRVRYADDLPKAVPVDAALLETPPTLFVRFGHAPLAILLAIAAWRCVKKWREKNPAPKKPAAAKK